MQSGIILLIVFYMYMFLNNITLNIIHFLKGNFTLFSYTYGVSCPAFSSKITFNLVIVFILFVIIKAFFIYIFGKYKNNFLEKLIIIIAFMDLAYITMALLKLPIQYNIYFYSSLPLFMLSKHSNIPLISLFFLSGSVFTFSYYMANKITIQKAFLWLLFAFISFHIHVAISYLIIGGGYFNKSTY